MSAKPAAPAAATDKPKGKKPLLLIVIAAVVLLGGGGAGAWFLLNKKTHAAGQEEVAAAEEPAKDAKPSFLALENMVVNLADPGGERVAQVGITLELESDKSVERIKQLQPKIRSSLLMLVSQRTSEEMLGRDGKEKLASDVMDEVSRVLGYEVDTPKPRKAVKVAKADAEDDEEEEVPKRKKSRRSGPPSPVQGVLFSSFIVQ